MIEKGRCSCWMAVIASSLLRRPAFFSMAWRRTGRPRSIPGSTASYSSNQSINRPKFLPVSRSCFYNTSQVTAATCVDQQIIISKSILYYKWQLQDLPLTVFTDTGQSFNITLLWMNLCIKNKYIFFSVGKIIFLCQIKQK